MRITFRKALVTLGLALLLIPSRPPAMAMTRTKGRSGSV